MLDDCRPWPPATRRTHRARPLPPQAPAAASSKRSCSSSSGGSLSFRRSSFLGDAFCSERDHVAYAVLPVGIEPPTPYATQSSSATEPLAGLTTARPLAHRSELSSLLPSPASNQLERSRYRPAPRPLPRDPWTRLDEQDPFQPPIDAPRARTRRALGSYFSLAPTYFFLLLPFLPFFLLFLPFFLLCLAILALWTFAALHPAGRRVAQANRARSRREQRWRGAAAGCGHCCAAAFLFLLLRASYCFSGFFFFVASSAFSGRFFFRWSSFRRFVFAPFLRWTSFLRAVFLSCFCFF